MEKIKNHIQMDFYEVLLLQTTITTTSDSVAPSASGYTTETAAATATKCHSSQPPMLHSSNLADGPIENMEKRKTNRVPQWLRHTGHHQHLEYEQQQNWQHEKRYPNHTTQLQIGQGEVGTAAGLTSQYNARTMMVSPVNDGWGWWGCWGWWGWWHYIHITVDSFTFKSKLKKGNERKIYKICLTKKYLHNRPTNNIHTYIYTNSHTMNANAYMHDV